MERTGVKLEGIERQWEFMLAGNALLTIENEQTGSRYTYRIKGRKTGNGKILYFVNVLSGSNNETDYRYVGTIFFEKGAAEGEFRLTSKSRVSAQCKSFKAFYWLFNMLQQGNALPEHINFYHAGSCGKCGRTLTVPESIETGLGPHCRQNIGTSGLRTLAS